MKNKFSGKRYFHWMGHIHAKKHIRGESPSAKNMKSQPAWAIKAFMLGFNEELLKETK